MSPGNCSSAPRCHIQRTEPPLRSEFVRHPRRDVGKAKSYQSKHESPMKQQVDCYDNAMMTSLWATLKKELVQHAKFRTRAQARSSIFEWIEVWYQRERSHSSLAVSLVLSAPNSSRRSGELVRMIVCPLKVGKFTLYRQKFSSNQNQQNLNDVLHH